MFWRCAILILIPLLASCSAIELHQQNVRAAGAASADIAVSTTESGPSANAGFTQVYGTVQALSSVASQVAETVTALAIDTTEISSTPAPDKSELTAIPPDFIFSGADTAVYGQVPVDSDRLNVVAALAIDSDGRLLVSTRAGEIYRLLDTDEDGIAEETRLVFRDASDELGQVSGLTALGEVLILLNDGQLSQLQDQDRDGTYDTVTHLSQGLPAYQNPLQANNSIVRAPDGRTFTANVGTGEILQIILR